MANRSINKERKPFLEYDNGISATDIISNISTAAGLWSAYADGISQASAEADGHISILESLALKTNSLKDDFTGETQKKATAAVVDRLRGESSESIQALIDNNNALIEIYKRNGSEGAVRELTLSNSNMKIALEEAKELEKAKQDLYNQILNRPIDTLSSNQVHSTIDQIQNERYELQKAITAEKEAIQKLENDRSDIQGKISSLQDLSKQFPEGKLGEPNRNAIETNIQKLKDPEVASKRNESLSGHYSELQELENQLARLTSRYEELKTVQNSSANQAGSNSSVAELIAHYRELASAQQDIVNQNAAQKAANDFKEAESAIASYIASVQAGTHTQAGYNAAISAAGTALDGSLQGFHQYEKTLAQIHAASEKADLQSWYQGLKAEINPTSAAQDKLNESLAKLNKLFPEGGKEFDAAKAHLQGLYEEASKSPFDKLVEELKEEERQLGLTAKARFIDSQQRKLGANATKEQLEEIERQAGKLFDSKAQKDSIADFNDGVAGFELTVESIGDAWKRTGNKASQAIGDMITTYQDFSKQSDNAAKDKLQINAKLEENEELRKKGKISQAKFEENEAKLKKDRAKLDKTEGENQIALYHGLAGAMSSAFAAGSKEAEAFRAVQQGIALYDGIRAVVNAWAAPYPKNLVMVPLTIAKVASLLGQMGQSFSGGSGGSAPSMSSEQIGFETAKVDNESVVNRLDQQIELLEAIERNGSASALNVDLASAEYQGALYEWVEEVFDKSKIGFVKAGFTEDSEHWARIEEHYKNLEIANPYEMSGSKIRINAEQIYRDPKSLIAVIQDISQMRHGEEGFNYSGPFGQALAEEYGYGEDAHAAFKASMRNTFTELQGHLNDWAVSSIESLTDLADASESMRDSFDAITGTTRYATEELDEAYAVFDRISGGDYAGYLEKNIDSIAHAESWLEQLTDSYDEHGNQLTNFQLLLSKDVNLFEDQAAALESFNEILGVTFEGGAEEALNFISSIELVAESLQKTRELEDQILELTNAEAYLITMRQRELDTLTDSQKVLQKQVWALEDWAEAQAAVTTIAGMIDDALSPLSDAERTLVDANSAMSALGMSGLTYRDALVMLDSYDNNALIELADTLGMSFEEIQATIQDIIDGNKQVTGSGSETLSVSAAESAVDAAEGVIWQQYGDIIDETFGGQIPTLEEFSKVYDNQADQLRAIQTNNAGIINQLGGLPSTVAELKDTYFDQFAGLTLVEPVDELGKQIAGAYQKFMGRLPDEAGLNYWLTEISSNRVSIEDVIGKDGLLATSDEAIEYGKYTSLRSDLQAYFDGTDKDIIGLDTALAALDSANGSLNKALINSADSATRSVNSAANRFLEGIRNQIASFDLEGQEKELFDLELWRKGLEDQAKEVGASTDEIGTLYDKKYDEIIEKYSQELTDTYQSLYNTVAEAIDPSQVKQFGLESALETLGFNSIGDAANLLDQITELTSPEGFAKLAETFGLTADELAEAVNTVVGAQSELDAFNDDISSQLQQAKLDGKDLELFNLEAWYDNLIKQANAVGAKTDELEDLYDIKRTDILDKYALEEAETLVEETNLNQYLQDVSDYISDQSQLIKDNTADQIAIMEQWQDVAKGLSDYVDQIRLSELSPDDPGEKLQQAQASFAELLSKAEQGDLEAAGQLTGAADAYLNQADSYYGRSDAYTHEFNYVANSLDALGIKFLDENGEDDITRLNQQMKDELQELSDYAKTEIEWAKKEAQALTGIEGALGSWPEKFDQMFDDLASDISSGVAAAIPTTPDRPTINPGVSTGTDTDTTSTNTDSVDTPPSDEGMSNSLADSIIRDFIGGRAVPSELLPVAAATLGITSISEAQDYIDGSHARGLSRVPFDGYRAKLHKDEMVLTADVSNHIRRSMDAVESTPGQRSHTEMLVELRALRESNQRLETELAALRFERKAADNTSSQQRDQQIYAAKSLIRANRSTVETV